MKPWIAVVVLALGCPLSGQGAPARTSHPQAEEDSSRSNDAVFPSWMAGRWTASVYEVTLSDDFHRSVYGPDARSVRAVALTIQLSGEGTFTVTNSVRDRAGHTVPGTRSIDDVRFAIGEVKRETGYQPRYTSRIAKAERRYPDDPSSTFALDGVKLEFFVPEGQPGRLDVRFDTPDGRGSFWETLRRVPRATRKS